MPRCWKAATSCPSPTRSRNWPGSSANALILPESSMDGTGGPGMKRVFLIAALSVIGGFAGAGIASVFLTLTVNQMPKSRGIEFLAGGIPWLASGGALGFVAAFLFGRYLFKERPALAQAEV